VMSDRTGWWNPYVWSPGRLRPALEQEAEFTVPPWRLGEPPYDVVDDDHLVLPRIEDGAATVVLLDLGSGSLETVTAPGTFATAVRSGDGTLAAVLQSSVEPARLAVLDLDERRWQTVRVSSELDVPPSAVSVAESVRWDGDQGEVHGWYYPPRSAEARPPAEERPPMIVVSHGGPTGMASDAFSLGYQFWTSRGIAILDVNYSGSSGFGREYRDRLRGRWGELDVADCVAGARAMADQGRADPDRLVIMGGSAGGYTALQALVSSDVFAAGVSSYGVGDLEALARDTHKFESRYLDGLVGPYPAQVEVYRDRSPVHHVDRLASPLLLLQGAEDVVVPPDQAKMMAAAVRAKGLPVALIIFSGEGHGFRGAETIRAAVQAELSFLGRILGFAPADNLPPVVIDNLPA
jgi:dipeptidyl aminopeptidase/acylaminoacyl peptidase